MRLLLAALVANPPIPPVGAPGLGLFAPRAAGKYLLMKDPNKAILRLYEVPHDEFEEKEPEPGVDEPADEVKEDSEDED